MTTCVHGISLTRACEQCHRDAQEAKRRDLSATTAYDPAHNYHTLRDANVTRNKEWDPGGDISLSFRGNEMAGELGELLEKTTALLLLSSKMLIICNMLKKLERQQLGLVGSRVSLEDVAKEFGDTLICLDLCAMQVGIDLEQATKDKFNEASIKHGLKTRYV